MKRLLGIILMMVVALSLAACSSGAGAGVPAPDSYTLHGTLSAPQCGGGYDIENANVEVRNEHDTLIGSTATGNRDYKVQAVGCAVAFTVVGLPKANFYSLKVGSHGGPNYSFTEMQAANWHVALTL